MKQNKENFKKEVVDLIAKIAKQNHDKYLLTDFMLDILTPQEFENVAFRWQIIKKLEKGVHHETIAEELSVGVATVTRGSRELRDPSGGFQRTLKFLKNDK